MNPDLADPGKIIAARHLWAAPELPFLPLKSAAHDLAAYMNLLLKWNCQLNLSGCDNALSLMRDLIQDSFFLLKFMQTLPLAPNLQIWDLGAGAGLPGIPLRILSSFGNYTWIEASQKRAIFLQTVQANLHLKNVSGHAGRVEDFFRQAGKADLIISRAFRPWREILDLCRPKLASGAQIVIMANSSPPDMPPGWRLTSSFPYQLPHKKRWFWAISPFDNAH